MQEARHLLIIVITVSTLAFLYLALFFYQLGAPMPAEYWVREIKVAKLHLARRIKEPKIVILGGSNGLFGIDSRLIEHETQIKTINLSLHAGLPLDYLVQYVKHVLKKGDILIMTLEYKYYFDLQSTKTNGLSYDSWFTNNMMTWDKRFFMELDWFEKVRFVFSVPLKRVLNGAVAKLYETQLLERYGARRLLTEAEVVDKAETIWRRKINEVPSQDYGLDKMSELGDFGTNTGTRYFANPDYYFQRTFMPNHHTWQTIKDIAGYCAGNDIRLFVAWPPTIEDTQPGIRSTLVQENMLLIKRDLKKIGIQTLGTPEDFSFERTYFFDTKYHLNAEGTLLRTKKLISLLEPALAQSNDVSIGTVPASAPQ